MIQRFSNSSSSAAARSTGSVDRSKETAAAAVEWSTGSVDRCAQRAQGCSGRPDFVAVDRPVDRLKVPNSRLGTVDRGLGRSTDRSTDSRVGLFRERC